jgi:hypothetical protein
VPLRPATFLQAADEPAAAFQAAVRAEDPISCPRVRTRSRAHDERRRRGGDPRGRASPTFCYAPAEPIPCPPRTRALVSAGSALLAAAVAAAWIASRPRSEAIRLKNDGVAAQKLLLDRRSQPLAVSGSGEGAVRTLREPLDLEAVKSLWAFDPAYHEFDPHVYFRYKGGLDLDFGNQNGIDGYHVHTSEDGYREDFVRLPKKRDLFVVVTGDSHTDGVCENRQTFSESPRSELPRAPPRQGGSRSDTGVTGYLVLPPPGRSSATSSSRPTPSSSPSTGQRLLDVIKPWHYFHHTAPPPRSREYWSKLSSAQELSSALVGNAFNELLYFQYSPDEIEVALRAAGEICEEIVRDCREHGILPVFVHIPPQVRGTPKQRERFQRIQKALELTDGDCAVRPTRRRPDREAQRTRRPGPRPPRALHRRREPVLRSDPHRRRSALKRSPTSCRCSDSACHVR